MSEIQSRLTGIRNQRGMPAAALARLAGVSRQTIYAMEAGDYVPNTAVALRLAQALEVTVEDLFALASAPPRLATARVELLAAGGASAGAPVELCRVDKKLVAVPAAAVWQLPTADGILTRTGKSGGRALVQFPPDKELSGRLLLAGCDPAMPVLARHAQKEGVDLVLAMVNSSESLDLLKRRSIHIAGTHLRDERTGESNTGAIAKCFRPGSVAVFTFAVWEEGLVIAVGNPKQIRGVEDLGRRDVTIVNREAGSGSRKLLDAHLRRAGIPHGCVAGYERLAAGHLPAAWHVQAGLADCCVATRAAARAFGLDFIPLAAERYDLVVHAAHLELTAVQRLLDVLSHTRFRRDLDLLGGYDTTQTGRRVA